MPVCKNQKSQINRIITHVHLVMIAAYEAQLRDGDEAAYPTGRLTGSQSTPEVRGRLRLNEIATVVEQLQVLVCETG